MATRPVAKSLAPQGAALPPFLSRGGGKLLSVADNSTNEYSAAEFFDVAGLRDPAASASAYLDQFIRENEPALRPFDITIATRYTGREVRLVLQTGNWIGSIALRSPKSARFELGLIVRPRFSWAGIGEMLAAMGWRVGPSILKLSRLQQSESSIPAWVLASIILTRISDLANSLDRTFETSRSVLAAPKGSVEWERYASVFIPAARFLSIPCLHPDLRQNKQLLGAIRMCVGYLIPALENQRSHGTHVSQLIQFARQILTKTGDVPHYLPSNAQFAIWRKRSLRAEAFRDGLEALEWFFTTRGLGGAGVGQGLPWILPMEQFFEAWVETLMADVAHRSNGRLRTGRTGEVSFPIAWHPVRLGGQRSLIPDLWLEWEDLTLIVDAKYKRHFEQMSYQQWSKMGEGLHEQHRHDLLQVLAYSTFSAKRTVIACLAYPCSVENYEQWSASGRTLHKAEILAPSRKIHLWLLAVPMNADKRRVSDLVMRELTPDRRSFYSSS